MRVIGRHVRPVDWIPKTNGSAKFAADHAPEGTLVARAVRSPHPLAHIVAIDTSAAAVMPGVHAVITARDLPAGVPYIHMGPPYSDRTVFASDLVRFVGQEVAAVAAETFEQAEAAAKAVVVKYRVIRNAPLSIQDALAEGAATLHDRSSGIPNVSVADAGSWGDPEAGLDASRHVVQGSFRFQRHGQAPMETNTTLAWWHPEHEKLELWTSTQAPWFIEQEVARVLGLDVGQVILRDVYVGGGFGSKSKISEHEAIAAALSKATGEPVLFALTREEEFATTKPRHAFDIDLTVHADETGRISMFETDVATDNGAYNHFGPSVMKVAIKVLGTTYRPDAVQWRARLVDTALPPGGQFRGYGTPQMAFAMESLVDEMAEGLGRDPLQFRIENANTPNRQTLSGAKVGSARLVECLEAVRESIGWEQAKADPQPRRGVGVAIGMHGSGAFVFDDANRSEIELALYDDGRITAYFGGLDAGTGQRTVLAEMVSEELGIDMADIEVVMADSESTPFDLGAFASRGTHISGHATRKGAMELADRVRELAAGKLSCLPSDVALRDGRAWAGEADVALGDLVGLSSDARDGALRHHSAYVDERMERFAPGKPTANSAPSYTFAAHAAEVDVDPLTGKVTVLRYVAAHDVGRALNPEMVRGQIIGGTVQGLGAALGEELIYEGGTTVNPAFINYAAPRAGDAPPVEAIIVEGAEEAGPYDAKSVGEMPIVLPAPVIANAVYDAIGVRIRDLPITPDKVLAAIAERDGRKQRQHHLWRRVDRWQIAVFRRLYKFGIKALLMEGRRFARRRSHREIEAIEHPTSVAGIIEHLDADAEVLGGGTDLMLQRQQGLAAPVRLLSVRDVEELRRHERDANGRLVIGGGVRLADLTNPSALTPQVVAQAAASIATPQVRAAATLAGNLLQEKRCWFFRNGFECYKRGGWTCPCFAVTGDHRFYHAAMGAHRCQAVTPSDLASALVASDAEIRIRGATGERTVPASTFYRGPGETVVADGEVVVAAELAGADADRFGAFEKLSLWQGDFAVTSVAVTTRRIDGSGGLWRVVLGGLAPTPWRSRAAEAEIERSGLDERSIDAVAAALDRELDDVGHPLPGNAWKLDATVGLLHRTLERLVTSLG